MKIRRLLNSPIGKMFISILLGLGLASLLFKAETDKNKIVFHGAVIDSQMIDGKTEDKIYKHDDKCYTYKPSTAKCSSFKSIIDVSTEENIR